MKPETKETSVVSGTTGLSRGIKETSINRTIRLDGTGVSEIHAGIDFFGHMLTLFPFHSGIGFTLHANGDLQVCGHHTVGGCGITMGTCLKEALQDKEGIKHYDSMLLPMDEALVQMVLNINGRNFLVYNCKLERDTIGSFSYGVMEESPRAFAFQAGTTLHVNVVYGANNHHKVEAIFKALGRALETAIHVSDDTLLSIKGKL